MKASASIANGRDISVKTVPSPLLHPTATAPCEPRKAKQKKKRRRSVASARLRLAAELCKGFITLYQVFIHTIMHHLSSGDIIQEIHVTWKRWCVRSQCLF